MRRRPPARPARVLLTGFGPFPGVPVNPTTALVRRVGARLARWPALGVRARVEVLATAWANLPAIERLIAETRPDAVVMTGVATGAHRIRLERTARNRLGPRLADVDGKVPGVARPGDGVPGVARPGDGVPGVARPGGKVPGVVRLGGVPGRIVSPAAARLPGLAGRLRRLTGPCAVSDDAGGYLCNAGYLTALAARRCLVGPVPVVFVHVPEPRCVRGRRPDDLAAAVERVVVALAGARPQRGA